VSSFCEIKKQDSDGHLRGMFFSLSFITRMQFATPSTRQKWTEALQKAADRNDKDGSIEPVQLHHSAAAIVS
jgi:hypothetical protein